MLRHIVHVLLRLYDAPSPQRVALLSIHAGEASSFQRSNGCRHLHTASQVLLAQDVVVGGLLGDGGQPHGGGTFLARNGHGQSGRQGSSLVAWI